MDILLASANKYKVDEFKELFKGTSVNLIIPKIDLDVEESGKTYSENAYLKAFAYAKKFKTNVLSEDSGIEIDALKGHLGVFSKRFGGEKSSYHDKNLLVLEMMKNVPFSKRNARMICTLCYSPYPNKKYYFFNGVVEGFIDNELTIGGFSYDAIFLAKTPLGIISFATEKNLKNIYSHRAKAVEVFLDFLKYNYP